jgi:acetylornithine/succinyldiaminopimelate/putrescine aminotransferase
MEEIFKNDLMNNVENLSNYFISKLKLLKDKFPNKVKEVRGLGFMLGVEFDFPCSKIVDDFRDNGILVNCTSENVVRILPPLISSKENIDQFLKVFDNLLKQ